MFARAFVWAAIVGATGFGIGFFGPLIVAPQANQGPLLGIFITGPAGVVLGFVLGLLPVAQETRWKAYWPLVALGLGTLFYFGGPDPLYLGQVLDAEVASCEEAAPLLPSAIQIWESGFKGSVRNAPPPGWKEHAARILASEPGVVVTVRVARSTSLLEGTRSWNRGKRWTTGWNGSEKTKRGFSRLWTTCAAAVPGSKSLLLSKRPMAGAWPAGDAAELLWLDRLEAAPERLAAMLSKS